MWKTMNGKEVKNLTEEIKALCRDGERKVYVGTDSQLHEKATEFVTVVCVLKPGKGGRAFYKRVKLPKGMALQTKLFKEVELSIEVAQELDKLPELNGNIVVHVDSNNKVECASTNYTQALVGWVTGSGFEVDRKSVV